MEIIKKFIEENHLDFNGYGSDLNSSCCILAGYTLYAIADQGDPTELIEYLKKEIDLSPQAQRELERVYDYAYSNNYYMFWTTDAAKEQYKF